MGQEWNAVEPFLFFCDFGPDLAPKVVEGRRQEFARFPAFSHPTRRAEIPDPQDEATVRRSTIRWEAPTLAAHREWLDWVRGLLHLRREEIVPRLRDVELIRGRATPLGRSGLAVEWSLGAGAALRLIANLGPSGLPARVPWRSRGRCLVGFPTFPGSNAPLEPWQVAYYLSEGSAAP